MLPIPLGQVGVLFMLAVLLIPILLATVIYLAVMVRAVQASKSRPLPEGLLVGAVVNFFDTLGIGSFAPTMAWLKFRGLVEDRLIPRTMLVGLIPPSMLQAIIFLILLGVMVDRLLLIGGVVALTAGVIVGMPLASRARVSLIQTIVGIGLILAALFLTLTNLELMPGGGTATGLPPLQTGIAIAACFIFGILVNFGVGHYAPTLVLLSLMGMDPRLCFPIMAAGAALGGAGAGIGYIRQGSIDFRIASAIALGGIPAVLVAAFVVKEMPVFWLRWMVVVVVLYAAIIMLRSAAIERRKRLAAL